MRRRSPHLALFGLVLIIGVLSGCVTRLGIAPPLKPNVLLIVADDLSPSYVSAYGAPGAPATPAIDDLAANGLMFTQAWANPACSPTRAGFYTGQHAFRHRIGHPTASDLSGLSTANSLPNVLLDAEYRSALFGKWHLDLEWQATGSSPSDQAATFPNLYAFGWHTYIGSPGGVVQQVAGPRDYRNWHQVEIRATPDPMEADVIMPGVEAAFGDVSSYVTTTTIDHAADWIRVYGNSPWFVTVAFNTPHDPFHDPNDPLDGANCPAPLTTLDCYAAMVQSLDAHVGLLRTSLENMKYDDGSSVYDHTIVIFIGDNGSPAGMEAAPFNPTICSSGVEQCAKTTVFEGGIRVPFIIGGGTALDEEPVGGALRGTRTDVPVHTTDLYETILTYAGLSSPGHDEDSHSLVELARTGTAPARSVVITEQFLGNDPLAPTSAQKVAIIEPAAGARIAKVQCDRTRTDQTTLYDLGTAPAPDFEEVIETATPNPTGTIDEQTLDRLLTEINTQRGGSLPCP